jgi:hypothetical protein
MIVQSYCHYLTRIDSDWTDRDYAASNVVKAVKGKPLHGSYSWVPFKGWRIKLQESSRGDLVIQLGLWGASVIDSHYPERNDFVLVPIPTHAAVVRAKNVPEYGSLRFARAIVRHLEGRAVVAEVIKWRRLVSPSHQGGSRDPREIYDNIDLAWPLDRNKVYVLVDDVMSTSAHMQAALTALHNHRVFVPLGLCVGRTALTQPRNPFRVPDDIVEALEDSFFL